MMNRLIFETQDGSHSILAAEYGVSYHSKYGAVQESRHVFIEAGLYYQALRRKEIAVLEFGLGTGLNALLTLQMAAQHGWRICYEAIEAYPIGREQAAQLNYTEVLNIPKMQSAFLQMHACAPNVDQTLAPDFVFRKKIALFQEVSFPSVFDLVYFDAFAPSAQPELWETAILQKAFDALCSGGVFVTYCAKGSVKRTLRNIGFVVEALPGPPGKREMTRALKH